MNELDIQLTEHELRFIISAIKKTDYDKLRKKLENLLIAHKFNKIIDKTINN